MPTEGKRDKRMLIWICAIMAVLMSCQGGMAQEVGDSFRQSAKADCGAQAVYLLLSLHHKPVVIEDVISSFVDEDSAGHSMLELAQASSRLGLPVVGKRYQPGQTFPDRPVIAYLRLRDAGHFFVIRPVGATGTLVQILDPPHEPVIMELSELVKRDFWTGALLVPEKGFLSHWFVFTLAICGSLTGLGLVVRRLKPNQTRTFHDS